MSSTPWPRTAGTACFASTKAKSGGLRNSSKGDEARAAQGYAAAVPYPDAPPDAWRWHGIMLLKQGQRGRSPGGLRPLSAAGAQRAGCRAGSPDDGRLRRIMMRFGKSFLLAAAASVACGLRSAWRGRLRLWRLFAGPGQGSAGRRRQPGGHAAARMEQDLGHAFRRYPAMSRTGPRTGPILTASASSPASRTARRWSTNAAATTGKFPSSGRT